MGHLTKRGWSAKTPTISSADAQEFKQRCRESHTAHWTADVTRWDGDSNVTLASDIPITGGTLTLDAGDQIRRQLHLEIGAADDALTDLAPWGQRVHLYVQIDRRDGGWFPPLKMFTGPIRENIYERPSLITTLECGDPGSTLHEFLHVRRKGYGGQTLEDAIDEMAGDALPGGYGLEASAGAATQEVETFVADAGQSRLEAANELAGKWGYELFFDWHGDAIIRRDLTDEDDPMWDPSEAGPDIGDVARPVAVFADGEGGNLIGTTESLSREGAVNGVAVNLDALRKKEGAEGDLHWSYLATAGGSMAWGDIAGRIPLVETKDVHKITANLQDRQTQRAKKLLKRRRGMTKFIDFDALPSYWVEPDDRVELSIAGGEENYYLERIEIDLTGGPMRCRTRILNTGTPT